MKKYSFNVCIGLTLLAISAGVANAQVVPQKQPCPAPQARFESGSWTKLQTGQGLALLEATYLGEGVSTGQSYFMHIAQFYNRSDLYTAVVENRVTKRAWIGVLEKSYDGVYNWRNLIISPDQKSLETNFIQSPVFQFSFEVDSLARPVRFTGTSLMSDTDTEAVRFSRMRSLKMTKNIGQGLWRYKKDRFTIIEQASDEECPGPSSYSGTYAGLTDDGRATARPYEIRPSVFAGIYTTHGILDADYDRRAQREIAFLVVHIKGYNDGWRDKYKTSDRVLTFEYNADANGAIPQSMPTRMTR
jgi:hypothetical protein